MCELDVGLSTSNSHDMRVFPARNGAGSHKSGTAVVHIPKGSCVWVRFRCEFRQRFAPELVNIDAPYPMLGTAAAHTVCESSLTGKKLKLPICHTVVMTDGPTEVLPAYPD